MSENDDEQRRADFRAKVAVTRAAEDAARTRMRERDERPRPVDPETASVAASAPIAADAPASADTSSAGAQPKPRRGAKGLAAARAAREKSLRDAPKKDGYVGVRYPANELAVVRTKAQESGLSVGAFIRLRTSGTAGPRARRAPPIEFELAAALLVEAKRNGNLGNQIARAMNRQQPVVAERALAVVDEMHRAVAAITAFFYRKAPEP